MEISSLTLSELRTCLDKREFSSEDLTNALFDRIEALAEINAFVKIDREWSLKQARIADKRLEAGERGELLGIPIAVKDMILTAGLETSAASRILGGFIPPYSATVIERIIDSGGVILGKTNMDEFAMGSSGENSIHGSTKNPWDFDRVPGGSSSGSAAAVAARLAPLALGTDTGGSVRQPASFCGVVGIKPTYGRVSRYGVVAYASSLDQVGVFGNTVRDSAKLLNIIAGHDKRDSTSVDRSANPTSYNLDDDIRGIRIGIPREYFVAGLESGVANCVRTALEHLEARGAQLVEIELPHTHLAIATYYIIAPAEASSNLARYDGVRFGFRAKQVEDLTELYTHTRSQAFGSEVKRRILMGSYVLSAGYYDDYYLRAQKVRRLIANDFIEALSDKCDVVAGPVAPTTAFRLGERTQDPLKMYLGDIFTVTANLAGLPAISIPCGFDQSDLPVGLQLIGRHWEESLILRIGNAYQQQSDWHTRVPREISI
ncbi:MAG: Asp-tRNA(Asn)/Glu-tRNA(Gln) amidotransferase subunit GatA [Bdellovibrionales bacterium]|nr:Asp-tRNA(Asn)/Glu-tRNA(Gln) amidotransferase subunit GatA [Bdellovibrionales bacterium]